MKDLHPLKFGRDQSSSVGYISSTLPNLFTSLSLSPLSLSLSLPLSLTVSLFISFSFNLHTSSSIILSPLLQLPQSVGKVICHHREADPVRLVVGLREEYKGRVIFPVYRAQPSMTATATTVSNHYNKKKWHTHKYYGCWY